MTNTRKLEIIKFMKDKIRILSKYNQNVGLCGIVSKLVREDKISITEGWQFRRFMSTYFPYQMMSPYKFLDGHNGYDMDSKKWYNPRCKFLNKLKKIDINIRK